MDEHVQATVLLLLGTLFGLSVLGGMALRRLRIPPILAALLVGMGVRQSPLGPLATDPGVPSEVLGFLGHMGAAALLFYIGLQLDLRELGRQGRDVLLLTLFASLVPFLLGTGLMLAMGYALTLSLVIGMTRIPTAEAVVVPILDEFDLTRTRMGRMIVGAGTLDDVAEVVLVVVVSAWIAGDGGSGWREDLVRVALGLGGVALSSVVLTKVVLPRVLGLLSGDHQLIMGTSLATLLLLSGLSESFGAGFVVGALAAGVALMHAMDTPEDGDKVIRDVRLLTYGFLGPTFFFSVGLHADLLAIGEVPGLALALFSASMLGKLGGAGLMVALGHLPPKEGFAVGVGLVAQLTTEIVVAQLLLDAGLVDPDLYTAIVAASTLTTLAVPLALSMLLRRWSDVLRET